MVYPDKNKRYVKIRKNHRNYQVELRRQRRVKIACIAGVCVVVIGLGALFHVPSRIISGVETVQEASQKKAAAEKAAQEKAAKAEKTEKAQKDKKDAKTSDKDKKAEDKTAKKSDKKADKQKDAKAKKEAEKKKKEADKKSPTEIIFTGDVLITDNAQSQFDKDGIDAVVEKDLKDQLKDADILQINNEFVFSDRGTPLDKEPIYRVPPKYIEVEKKIGVDVAGLANNHFLDFGKEAVDDTLFTFNDNKIKYIGAGNSFDEAKKVVKIKKHGKTFGFVMASHILPGDDWNAEKVSPGIFTCDDPNPFIDTVAAAKEDCDYVFACVHWGAQDTTNLEDYEGDIARALIDAGADAVVGSHPHVVQTIDFHKGKPIFYSLGNFIFGDDIDQTVAAHLSIAKDGKITTSLIPAYAEGAVTKIADENRTKAIYKSITDISPTIRIAKDGKVTEK